MMNTRIGIAMLGVCSALVGCDSRRDAIEEHESTVPDDRSQERRLPGMPLGTRGGMRIECTFPADAGPYQVAFRMRMADTTRVVTFMLGRELNFRTYPEIGIDEGHHGLSHHQDRPEQIEKLARLNTYQTDLFAGYLDKLKSTPEGDGTLLDSSLFLYGASLSNPNLHAHYDLPLTVVGGDPARHLGGRHLVFESETPMTNLLLSLLDQVGVHAESLGDATDRLEIEPLTGV